MPALISPEMRLQSCLALFTWGTGWCQDCDAGKARAMFHSPSYAGTLRLLLNRLSLFHTHSLAKAAGRTLCLSLWLTVRNIGANSLSCVMQHIIQMMYVLLSSFSYENRNSCKTVGRACEKQDAQRWIHQTTYPTACRGLSFSSTFLSQKQWWRKVCMH